MGDDVLRVVNRSNQRGGRMLSLIDLIEADTVTLPLAAWLTERVEAGDSFLVGALPGGAGKTAIMGALLVMVPGDEPVRVTSGGRWRSAGPGETVVAYEISPASYEAYIWGREVRTFVELGISGARLVANLHADTLEQALTQLSDDNGVPDEHLSAFDFFVPITMNGGLGRRARIVEKVDYRGGGSTGGGRSAEGWGTVGRHPELSGRAANIAGFLEECRRDGRARIEEVRERWLAFRRS